VFIKSLNDARPDMRGDGLDTSRLKRLDQGPTLKANTRTEAKYSLDELFGGKLNEAIKECDRIEDPASKFRRIARHPPEFFMNSSIS
jgi:hypothetical protein